MDRYTYKDGSMIEIEVTDGAPDVVFAMGEYHIGDYRIEKIYHATAANGESQACDTWEDARQFLDNNRATQSY